jgi:diguanylate cyclase (GGDEF)-like protein/PAS domain S-box-containing protein
MLWVLGLVALAAVNFSTQQGLVDYRVRELRATAGSTSLLLRDRAAELLRVQDAYRLSLALAEVVDTKGALYAAAYDADGRLIGGAQARRPYSTAAAEPLNTQQMATDIPLVTIAGDLLDVIEPVYSGERRLGVVRVGFSLHDVYQERANVRQRNIPLAVIFLMVGIALTYWLAGTVTRPLRLLTGAAEQVARGNLQVKLTDQGVAELRVLSSAFNDMVAHVHNMLRAKAYDEHIINSLIDSVIVVDRDGRICMLNTATCELLGYTEAELIGAPIAQVLDDDNLQIGQGVTGGELLAPGLRLHGERCYRTRDGDAVPVLLSASCIEGENGEVEGYLCVARDITDRKQAEQTLAHQAAHDPLTGLPNRARLQERLRSELASAATQASPQPFALLLIDLDRFKEVNDTFGHGAGDQLLQHVATSLTSVLRGSDVVARLGGDEFAVFLPVAQMVGATLCARKLLTVLDEPVQIQDAAIMVRASIGIALFPEHGDSIETLLRRADVAMYTAKRAGGGVICYSPSHDQHDADRLALVAELRAALDAEELCLHYQPIVQLPSGKVQGVEALVRWMHSRRGLLMPGEFVPMAEDHGLIALLSRWVLRSALHGLRDLQQTAPDLGVSINLTAVDLEDAWLPNEIADLLDELDVEPTRLRIELTESVLMSDPERALGVLTRLRDMGVRVAIDDFGTGYSSLAYLKRLPVDELKIDRSFVGHMARDENGRTIVRATIELAHSLGITVVAEGVEDERTWQLLTELHCDAAQGYHISRPQTAEELHLWLAESSAAALLQTTREVDRKSIPEAAPAPSVEIETGEFSPSQSQAELLRPLRA